jgi:hypothetical protein
MAIVALNESEVINLPLHLGNLYRLFKLGYGNSRVTPLTTPASLIADIQTFRDTVANPSDAPTCDAAIDAVRWATLYGILDTTIITALTTVFDLTVSATTDLSWNFRGHAQYPSGYPNTGADRTTFQPAT